MSSRRRASGAVFTATGVLLAPSLAACGSRLHPAQVASTGSTTGVAAAADGAPGTVSGSGSVTGGDAGLPRIDPGTSTGTSRGTSGTAPGAEPNIYGVYAWSAARLFVGQAVALGGKLNRQTLLQALSKVRDWTANGMHVPQDVGAKTSANCASIIQLDQGTWTKVSPGEFLCSSMSNVGT